MSLRFLLKGLHQPLQFRCHLPHLCRFYAEKSNAEIKTSFEQPLDIEQFRRNSPLTDTFINTCLDYGLPEVKIVETAKKIPDVSLYSTDRIRMNLDQLFELGFSHDKVAAIIFKYPYILNYEDKDIVETFETWREANLHERFLWDLFSQQPWLFSVSNQEVKYRIERLNYLMVCKVNRVTRILLNCPELLIKDWKDVEDAFMYVTKTLRYTEKDISSSTALMQPMSFIRLRFTFLERVGAYKRPKLKDEDLIVDTFRNPPLKNVLDTNDESFAVNVAKVSSDEYEVFKKLVAQSPIYRANDADIVEHLNLEYHYDST